MLPTERDSRFPRSRNEYQWSLISLKTFFFFFSYVIFPAVIFSQGLPKEDATQAKADALISHLRQLTSIAPSGLPGVPEKCGFHYQFDVKSYWNSFTLAQREFVQSIFARPQLQKSILSPSGHFRVHFDTTGVNTPALLDNSGVRITGTARAYADSVAAVFDYVWDFETRVLGYPPPPADKGVDGGNEYDIYILEVSQSFYGQTIFNEEDVLNAQRPNPTYASFIEIDNDYRGYFSSGIRGLKVTAAHEFHHSIQVGNYGFWVDDVYYYEITSTWMEDVVYNDINDYYQYLGYYFRNTTIPFNVSDNYIEYGRSLWGKFIEKRFGRDMMRRSWEYINTLRSLPAIDVALREKGTSFMRELPEFSLWHFYTGGKRADPLNYFSEASSYPDVRVVDIGSFIPPSAVIADTARHLSFQFFRLTVPRTGGSDTLSVDVTNLNVAGANQGDNTAFPFSFRLTTETGDESYSALQNGLRYKLLVDDPTNWKSLTFLNLGLTIADNIEPYPNPFFAGKSGGVAFPISTSQKAQATLNIYSTSLKLVISKVTDSITQYGQQVIEWDGRDSRGEFVQSGIYVYHLVSGEKEYKGKIAVVRQ